MTLKPVWVMVSEMMTIQEKIERIDKSRDQIELSTEIISIQLQNISNDDSEQEKILVLKLVRLPSMKLVIELWAVGGDFLNPPLISLSKHSKLFFLTFFSISSFKEWKLQNLKRLIL